VWGDAAVYVPLDSDDALAAALERLLGDDTLRGMYAMQAWARSREYTAERMARSYHALYSAALRNAAPAPVVLS
jgi:glycosyltransferase involved in cell wall biosynthesis